MVDPPSRARGSAPRARGQIARAEPGQGHAFVKKIYVGNLPWSTTEADLRDLFARFGEVQSAAVITDRETGRSRGFGFVELEEGAEKAIAELDGRDFGGRTLRVNEAQQKRGGGGGGGGRRERW